MIGDLELVDAAVQVFVGVLIAFIVGLSVAVRRIINLLTQFDDHVLPHFAPGVDEYGREVVDHTLPERVRRIEAELSFDHGESVKDVVGQIARANGLDAPQGPDDDG